MGIEKKKGKTRVTVISKISERPVLAEACLVVIYGNELGKRYGIDRPTVTVGRSVRADIRIDEDAVSRNHAKLMRTTRGVMLRDLGSTNGTYVNDHAVTEHILTDGDLIKVGRSIFKFLTGANIENQYHEEVYRLTTIDGLTAIFNKRYFLEAIERELSRCRRYHRRLSLIMIDVDHFKAINDQYGHVAGDSVLRQVATVIREKIRREDTFARYGGEEFGILLPETGPDAALAFAEKVRKLVEKATFHFEKARLSVTISAGAATLGDGMDSAVDVIRVADKRLYEAKTAGRNQVRG